MPVVELVAVS